jgi:acetylornithine/LysW-gamma-L-lysine aminotransferase
MLPFFYQRAELTMTDQATHSSQQIEASLTSGIYGKRNLCLVRGKGSRVWTDDGREFIDFIAGIGTLSLGHCPPPVVEAIEQQARTMISCTELFYNDARARLLERLDEITSDDFARFFLCSSGTEAVEAALKFARVSTKRTEFVSFERAFHGRTFGALSATPKKAIREPFEPLLDGFHAVPFNDIEALHGVVNDNTAAVIIEPIQGEGGIYEMTEEMAAALNALHERGVMIIADEIQAGIFRTGKAFAYENYGLQPDFICMAKALGCGFPVGTLAVGNRVPELPKGCHGTTYGGTPLACAAAEAVLRTIVENDLGGRALCEGWGFRNRLKELNLSRIKEVRGLGLFIGIQLDEDPAPVVNALEERGLLVLTAGVQTIRMLPPFNTPEADFEEALGHLAAVLA